MGYRVENGTKRFKCIGVCNNKYLLSMGPQVLAPKLEVHQLKHYLGLKSWGWAYHLLVQCRSLISTLQTFQVRIDWCFAGASTFSQTIAHCHELLESFHMLPPVLEVLLHKLPCSLIVSESRKIRMLLFRL